AALAAALALVPAAAQSNRDADYKGPTTSENALPVGYFDAVVLIKAKKYAEAIPMLISLKLMGNADVQNWLGYSYRKLKRMDESRVHYEAALRIDPEHLPTLEYYGEWLVEMGQIEAARVFLAKIETRCGRESCEAWRDLKFAIDTGKPREH
ncbi:MAG: tetratricopeptide repeat protein, partial [Beijerinckiaceae bacterium]